LSSLKNKDAAAAKLERPNNCLHRRLQAAAAQQLLPLSSSRFNEAAAAKHERPDDCRRCRHQDSTTPPLPNSKDPTTVAIVVVEIQQRHCRRRDSTTPPPPNSKDPTTIAVVVVEV
jgi:hypothetical protein